MSRKLTPREIEKNISKYVKVKKNYDDALTPLEKTISKYGKRHSEDMNYDFLHHLGSTKINENKRNLDYALMEANSLPEYEGRQYNETRNNLLVERGKSDIGNYHPEEFLTVSEPLAVTDTNLDAALPRRRTRMELLSIPGRHKRGRIPGSHARLLTQRIKRTNPLEKPLSASYDRLPLDIQHKVNEYIRPGRETMTHKESVDVFLENNSKHRKVNVDKKSIRRHVDRVENLGLDTSYGVGYHIFSRRRSKRQRPYPIMQHNRSIDHIIP